jgi:hypothetical protein
VRIELGLETTLDDVHELATDLQAQGLQQISGRANNPRGVKAPSLR